MLLGMGVNGKPDEKRRSCFDCANCKGTSISWWCTNENAVEERGTRRPGIIKCPHWQGIPTEEELKEKAGFISKLLGLYKLGYMKVDLSANEKR